MVVVTVESCTGGQLDCERWSELSTGFQRADAFHSAALRLTQGGETVDLVPVGASVPVNSANVYLYVQKYAELRMVRCQEKALKVGTAGRPADRPTDPFHRLLPFSCVCVCFDTPITVHACMSDGVCVFTLPLHQGECLRVCMISGCSFVRLPR